MHLKCLLWEHEWKYQQFQGVRVCARCYRTEVYRPYDNAAWRFTHGKDTGEWCKAAETGGEKP